MAVHNYASTYGTLPPAFVADREGRPMHSWRVLLLPFLNQGALYDEYRFDEPWDGPNNRKLLDRVDSSFRRPESEGSVFTSFVAVVGHETAFPGARALRFDEVSDGTSNTILFVEIDRSDIPWMEPRDLMFDAMSYRVNDPSGRGIGSPYGGARVAAVDGMIRVVRDGLPPAQLRAFLTVRGGEAVDFPGVGPEVEEGRVRLK